jgi:signal transduction histidine kinase
VSRVGLRGRVVLAAALVELALAIVFGMLVWTVNAYQRTSGAIRSSDRAIAQASQLQNLVLDLETGLRGFALTGDERFLEPWTSARRQLVRAATRLEGLDAHGGNAERARRIAGSARDYLYQYSVPTVALARRSREAARRQIAGGEGRRRVDAMRELFSEFVAEEQAAADEEQRSTDRLSHWAIGLGIAGLAGTALLVGLAFGYLSRGVVLPLRGLAAATGRLAAGDLSARVPDTGRRDEVGRLEAAFNTMAGSLEEAREQLAHKRDRVIALHRFAARLTSETEVEALELAILEELAELGRAEAGAVYAVGVNSRGSLRLGASRGLHPDRFAPQVEPGEGLSGRALVERVPIAASHGPSGLTLAVGGEEIVLGHELHLPLVQGDRALGVVVLARGGDATFSGDELELLPSMASQAAVALSNALALRRARRDASITRAVLDATPDGICLTDVDGLIMLANAPMLELAADLGLSTGGTVYDSLLSGADRMADPDAYRAGMQTIAESPDGEFRQEYTLAESGRSFLGYVAPVRDSRGTLSGRVFMLRETTAERQAERLKDELVATVSHELRTPLTSIIGYLELALEEGEGEIEPERRQFLEIVERNARRLLEVVGDLLFVAQVEAGRLVIERRRLDVAELAREAMETVRPLAVAKSLDVHVAADRSLHVRGDRLRLAQLLANLVSNAVKFTLEGGMVEIQASEREGRAVLEVSDTGIGIPAAEQERMFERFFRSSRSEAHAITGTGLGLVICKAIAEAHGGSISFTSTEGVGTTFRVELPLAAQASAVRRRPEARNLGGSPLRRTEDARRARSCR